MEPNNDVPQLSKPEDLTYYKDSSQTIIWTVLDSYYKDPYYTISIDTIPVSGLTNNTWIPDSSIYCDLVNLETGNHTVELNFSDGLGKSAVDFVQVTVLSVVEDDDTSDDDTSDDDTSDDDTTFMINGFPWLLSISIISILIIKRNQQQHQYRK